MKSTLYRCALAAWCAGAAMAQSSTERVLSLRYAESPASMQTIFNSVRAVADIKDAVLDTSARTITLRGPADQVNTGEWLFQQLDRPSRSAGTGPEPQELRPAGTSDDVTCVYFLSHMDTAQAIQEGVNAARSISSTRRMFPVNEVRAIAMRGTESQVAMDRWLLHELDAPPPSGGAMVVDRYAAAGPEGAAIRVFFLANLHHPLELQQAVNATRSVADVQRFFAVNMSYAIAMRGSDAQADLCEWMLAHLDTQGTTTTGEYLMTGFNDGLVRVFLPANVPTPDALQEVVNRVRGETRAQRVYPFSPRSAVIFRGTPAQVAIAESLINQH